MTVPNLYGPTVKETSLPKSIFFLSSFLDKINPLPYEMKYGVGRTLTNKLTIHVLEADDMQRISSTNYSRALSPPDKSVLYVAEKLEAILLSSDNVIRKYAKKEKIQIHGLFWVFDELVEKDLIKGEKACSLLNQLFVTNLMYKNSGKLWKEAEKRINGWKE